MPDFEYYTLLQITLETAVLLAFLISSHSEQSNISIHLVRLILSIIFFPFLAVLETLAHTSSPFASKKVFGIPNGTDHTHTHTHKHNCIIWMVAYFYVFHEVWIRLKYCAFIPTCDNC